MTTAMQPHTSIAYSTRTSIHVREHDLVNELIGRIGFVEMMLLNLLGHRPSHQQVAVVEAVMVTLMEHGLTPSAIAARLIYSSAPEAIQGAIAAGILAAGSNMLGTLENSAILLEDLVAAPAGVEARASEIVREAHGRGERLPGFGHMDHRPDDPRPFRHFEIAAELGLPGRHVAALKVLARIVDEVHGRHVTINASASMAALLCEVGLPREIYRGIAVVTRAAGLLAHIHEEQRQGNLTTLIRAAEAALPYRATAPDGDPK